MWWKGKFTISPDEEMKNFIYPRKKRDQKWNG